MKNVALLATAAALLAGLAYWFLYEPKTFIPHRLANDYSNEFKVNQQIEPGWVLRSVARRVNRPTRIVHLVEVRPELAGELLTSNKSDRIKRVGRVACPPQGHAIWQKLSSRQDIEIELQAENGIFAVISCRQAIF